MDDLGRRPHRVDRDDLPARVLGLPLLGHGPQRLAHEIKATLDDRLSSHAGLLTPLSLSGAPSRSAERSRNPYRNSAPTWAARVRASSAERRKGRVAMPLSMPSSRFVADRSSSPERPYGS